MPVKDYNPFSKRSEYSSNHVTLYKIFTVVSWLLVVVAGIYYTFNAPECSHHCHKIWNQNKHRPTPFTLNSVVSSIYWIVVLILQANYVRYFWTDTKNAASVASYFIVHNLLTFGFMMCWVRGHFWPGELLLVINMFNLTSLYFEHPTTPRFMHIAVVSAPWAWNFMALFWCGAAMVNAQNLPARIVANIFIWSILGVGAFFILVFKDYTLGFELTILTLALALSQFFTKVIALQWIFAFIIMGILFLLTLLIAVPGMFGADKTVRQEGRVVDEDRERAPLLDDR